MKITPERQAGLLFLGVVVCILILIAIVLGTSVGGGLRYTVVFNDAKGLRVGDRVRLSGMDIGEVDRVEFDRTGEKVNVRLKIKGEHGERVLLDSTAYIRNPTTLNVSGQKIVEIANSPKGSEPMREGEVIEGKDSALEFKAWQLGQKLKQWGSDIGGAAQEIGAGAKDVAKGIGEKAKRYFEEREEKIEVEPGGRPRGERELALPPEAESPAEPSEEDSSPQTSEILKKLALFLAAVPEKAKAGLEKLLEEWARIKAEVAPVIEKLIAAGKELLGERLQKLIEEIEKMFENLPLGPAAPGDAEDEPIRV